MIMLNISQHQLSTSLPSPGFLTSSLPPSNGCGKARVPSPRPRNKQKQMSVQPPSPTKSPTNSPHMNRRTSLIPPIPASNENDHTSADSDGYKTLEPINEPPMPRINHSPKSKRKSEEDESPISLGELVLKYSTFLPLQIQVKKGYHGNDERRCIAAEDVYNIHFVKHTKVVVLRDRRGVKFNIPLNSAVHFAPVFNPNNNIKEAMKGFTYERVSDLMALKVMPKIVHATKPHIRVDSKATIEKSEVFIIQNVVQIGMRKKVLQVFSITCNQNKLLQADSVGGFTTNPHYTYLYLLEIIEHFLNALPLDVQVVMDDGDMSRELPNYLTREVATLTHIDSETSLIASTSWGENETVLEEDQMPLDIPIDLPIEVVVQAADDLKEPLLSDYTKKLFEKFDPCRIRVLRSRNIRRGFEKEGMELERPDRIYDVPDVCLAKNARKTKSVSPKMRPRLATPATSLQKEPAYAQAYQSLTTQTKVKSKPQYAAPEPQDHPIVWDGNNSPTPPPEPIYTKAYQCLVHHTKVDSNKPQFYAEPDTKQKTKSPTSPQNGSMITKSSPPVAEKRHKSPVLLSPLKTRPLNELSSSISSNGSLNERVENEGERMLRHTSPLSSPNKNDRDIELLDTRVEVLEREVYALRAEIAKLKTQVTSATSSNDASSKDDKKAKKKNIEYLKVLSISEVSDLLEHMNLGQYKETFMKEQISGDILTECTSDVLCGELGVSSKIHVLRIQQIINGQVSVKDVMNITNTLV